MRVVDLLVIFALTGIGFLGVRIEITALEARIEQLENE